MLDCKSGLFSRTSTKWCGILAMTVALFLPARCPAEEKIPLAEEKDLMWLVSPLAGSNRSKLIQRGPGGSANIRSKTAPEYGLFALVAHPRFVINDFLFFTEAANGTDVMGNFLHANFYGDQSKSITWNFGAGHLYHKIEPAHDDIDVNVLIARAGPVLSYKPWNLAINPYVGFAREHVSTVFGSANDNSVLCGLSVDWRWRMFNLNCKYYYQDTRKQNNSFNNVHVRATGGITRKLGLALRFDHIEQSAVKNTSVLAGPVFVF